MADYSLLKMRIRQESKLATMSSKIDKDRALAGYRQAQEINNRVIEEQLLRFFVPAELAAAPAARFRKALPGHAKLLPRAGEGAVRPAEAATHIQQPLLLKIVKDCNWVAKQYKD